MPRKPYNKSTGRKYTGPDGDYEKFQSSDKAKKERAKRNKNRREALREGRVHKGDSLEIDHFDGNPNNNSKKNLKVVSRSKNRAKK
jgi:hypothetical protein